MGTSFCVGRIPLFNHLAKKELDQVQRLVRYKIFRKGEIIFSPNSDNQLVFVVTGQMKVYKLISSGKEQLLRIVENGGIEGEEVLFRHLNTNLYGEALRKTEVCLCDKNDFQVLLKKYPEVEHKLLAMNIEKSCQLEQQAQFLIMDRIEDRLLYYLLELSKNQKNEEVVKIPMLLRELAGYLGTSPETISRKLKKLEQLHLIEREGRTVYIHSINNLKSQLNY